MSNMMSSSEPPSPNWRVAGEALPPGLALGEPRRMHLPSGREVSLPLATTTFRTWPAEVSIDTWGGKAVLDVNGEQTFAEVAVLRMFQESGWEARWLEAYNAAPGWPIVLDAWAATGIKACKRVPIADPRVEETLRQVIANNDGKCRGCWDVVAWRGEALVLVEVKRTRQDRISKNQKRWVDAALDAGLSPEAFLIVEWEFCGGSGQSGGQKEGKSSERALWNEAPAGQKSFLVEVLHWYHFRTPALRGSWRTEEALTWELIRALQLLPPPVLLAPLLRRLEQAGGEALAATGPLLEAEVEIVPYPSLGYVEERQNCRSDVGLNVSGTPRVWLEAKTRIFAKEDLVDQLTEQRAALARITPGHPTAVVAILPVALAAPFQPCLTWADVVAAVDEGLDILGSLLPDEKLRRGYETLAKELAERIRTHPNQIAG